MGVCYYNDEVDDDDDTYLERISFNKLIIMEL